MSRWPTASAERRRRLTTRAQARAARRLEITTERGPPVQATRALKLLYAELGRLGPPKVKLNELRCSSAAIKQGVAVSEAVRMRRSVALRPPWPAVRPRIRLRSRRSTKSSWEQQLSQQLSNRGRGPIRSGKVEATTGFEPMNRGFADLRVEPLRHVALWSAVRRVSGRFGCPSRIRTSPHGSKSAVLPLDEGAAD